MLKTYGDNKSIKNLANLCWGDPTIDKIGLSGHPSL